jgi:hypothetical protein
LVLHTLTCRIAAEEPDQNLRRAINSGAKSKFTFQIKDSDGNAISNATIKVGFEMLTERWNHITGNTDSNGTFIAESISQWQVSARISKAGYYDSIWELFLARDNESVSGDRWLPWKPMIPVVLREVRNPIPMFVKHFDGVLPNGATAGFDCEVGDFTVPFGKGQVSDFTVMCKGSGVPGTKTRHSISLNALDLDGGFKVAKRNPDSVFKSNYLAPEQGYTMNISATMEYNSKSGVSGSPVFQGDEYLLFKSRIQRDPNGKIMSANFGKFYTEIKFIRGVGEFVGVSFLYYFNPTPNDRNLEFDGKTNLFKPDWRSKLNWSCDP